MGGGELRPLFWPYCWYCEAWSRSAYCINCRVYICAVCWQFHVCGEREEDTVADEFGGPEEQPWCAYCCCGERSYFMQAECEGCGAWLCLECYTLKVGDVLDGQS